MGDTATDRKLRGLVRGFHEAYPSLDAILKAGVSEVVRDYQVIQETLKNYRGENKEEYTIIASEINKNIETAFEPLDKPIRLLFSHFNSMYPYRDAILMADIKEVEKEYRHIQAALQQFQGLHKTEFIEQAREINDRISSASEQLKQLSQKIIELLSDLNKLNNRISDPTNIDSDAAREFTVLLLRYEKLKNDSSFKKLSPEIRDGHMAAIENEMKLIEQELVKKKFDPREELEWLEDERPELQAASEEESVIQEQISRTGKGQREKSPPVFTEEYTEEILSELEEKIDQSEQQKNAKSPKSPRWGKLRSPLMVEVTAIEKEARNENVLADSNKVEKALNRVSALIQKLEPQLKHLENQSKDTGNLRLRAKLSRQVAEFNRALDKLEKIQSHLGQQILKKHR